jgi:hypothetical protein
MKARLIEFIRKSKNPLAMEQSWNTQKIQVPKDTQPGANAGPSGVEPPGPSAGSLDSFMKDIDIPEELSVSSLQGNPSQPSVPGLPSAGDTFREKLRRRRSKDYMPSGGLTHG